MENFDYVVFEKPKAKICFGSGLPLDVLPQDGPGQSNMDRRYNVECRRNIGPQTHKYDNRNAFYDILKKTSSKIGTLPRAARFYARPTYQPPPGSDPIQTPIKQNKAPFNAAEVRMKGDHNAIPGPGSYVLTRKIPMKISGSFNGEAYLVHSVKTKCMAFNTDACEICSASCSQTGDYWHNSRTKQSLCRNCMVDEFTTPTRYSRQQLSHFVPFRDCFWAHKHENTRAGIRMMTNKQIEKKIRNEAYLCQYFPMIK